MTSRSTADMKLARIFQSELARTRGQSWEHLQMKIDHRIEELRNKALLQTRFNGQEENAEHIGHQPKEILICVYLDADDYMGARKARRKRVI